MPEIAIWFFISSGLFLGWSLGANHAVNVFGTAVVSKMVRFRTAALIGGGFAILGSVISGAGTTRTITDLGSINAIAGSFAVALAVGLSVTFMTRAKLPVSTSQAVIGAIIGWNLFTGSPTDLTSLSRILFSWVASPVLAGLFGYGIFKLMKRTVLRWKIHLLDLDNYTRIGLIVVGSLAAYSLGANNIANVMGLFASAPVFDGFTIGNVMTITGVQQLFFLGGLAIAVGMLTYGREVMETVGNDLLKISPITGFVVVLAEFVVLSLFTSQTLEGFLLSHNLPAFPLVPLSTTQAFIGAVIGVGLAKDPFSINFQVLGKIAAGWAIAPLSAGLITFVSLFFIQNVFEQKVINPVPYEISPSAKAGLDSLGVPTKELHDLVGQEFVSTKVFKNALMERRVYSNEQLYSIFQFALVDSFRIDTSVASSRLDTTVLSAAHRDSLRAAQGLTFRHRHDFLAFLRTSGILAPPSEDKLEEKRRDQTAILLEETFRVRAKSR